VVARTPGIIRLVLYAMPGSVSARGRRLKVRMVYRRFPCPVAQRPNPPAPAGASFMPVFSVPPVVLQSPDSFEILFVPQEGKRSRQRQEGGRCVWEEKKGHAV